MNDVQIANWLNENGHLTPRGNTFRNNHVHSIAKKRKRRNKEEELKRKYPEEWSDFSLEVVNQTILMSDFD